MTKSKKTAKADKVINESLQEEPCTEETRTEEMQAEQIETSSEQDQEDRVKPIELNEASESIEECESQPESTTTLTQGDNADVTSQADNQPNANSSAEPAQTETSRKNGAQDSNRNIKMSKTPLVISLLALLTAIGSSTALFYYTHQQSTEQLNSLTQDFKARELTLQKEIDSLKATLNENSKVSESRSQRVIAIKDELETALKSFETKQANTLNTWAIAQETAQSRLNAVEDKVNRLATQDNTAWLVSQADFYIKMAARRLWSERDVLTAMALLKTADSSLAEMNDSSLIETRSAIAADIATLAALNPPDIDGVVARLTTLTNTVDALILKPEYRWVTDRTQETSETTGSISDWRQNLTTNWRNFSSDFISIQRVDGEQAPILMPEQVTYLRENIRARLFLATQAVSRRQDAVYQQTLTDVLVVVNAYFDVNDKQTQHIVNELTDLQKQPLAMTLPEKFQSAELVARLVQDRVTKWVNQPNSNRNTQNIEQNSAVNQAPTTGLPNTTDASSITE